MEILTWMRRLLVFVTLVKLCRWLSTSGLELARWCGETVFACNTFDLPCMYDVTQRVFALKQNRILVIYVLLSYRTELVINRSLTSFWNDPFVLRNAIE
jgi:hypothetical protein